jgi:hypothetical protein
VASSRQAVATTSGHGDRGVGVGDRRARGPSSGETSCAAAALDSVRLASAAARVGRGGDRRGATDHA